MALGISTTITFILIMQYKDISKQNMISTIAEFIIYISQDIKKNVAVF